MESKIGDYKMLEKLSTNSVIFVEDSAGSKKILKRYELDSSWFLNLPEIKVLMALKHTNLLPPSDIFEEEKSKYAVYEYSHLNNLYDYLKRKVKLTEEEVLTILNQMIDGYQFLRENGLIHGNIKPTNILVDDDGKLAIKLTDFLLKPKQQPNLLLS